MRVGAHLNYDHEKLFFIFLTWTFITEGGQGFLRVISKVCLLTQCQSLFLISISTINVL